MPFKSIWRNQRGATAVIYGLMVIPILAFVGLTLDISRLQSNKVKLQSAVDAAVLAATKELADANVSDAFIQNLATDFFNAEMLSSHSDLKCAAPVATIDRVESTVALIANCTLPTTISGLASVSEFKITETSKASAAITRLDLALMLDISGSMGGQKIIDLQTAAKDAINALITNKTGNRVRVALVPYASSVNVGTLNSDVFDSSHAGEVCASERIGTKAFTDDIPGVGQWIETVPSTCPSSTVMPLTNSVSALEAHIDAFTPSGGTAGHLGVAWSWYMISRDWHSMFPTANKPMAYGATDSIKAVILMTDGAFNTQYEAAQGTSFEQAELLCNEMKAKGVIIFSVAFQAPPDGEAILQTCASDATYYFDAANGAQLIAAYDSIASTLSQLRIKS